MRIWPAIAVLVLTAACAPIDLLSTPTPARTPTAAIVFPSPRPGWTVYSRSTYQLALPAAWRPIELDEAELRATIQAAQEANAPLAESLRALLESGRYRAFVFYAAATQPAAVIQNVSVVRIAGAGTNDIQSFARATADALPGAARGARVEAVRAPLTVNGLDAAEIVYTLPVISGDGDLVNVRGVQYLYLLDSGDAYVMTVAGDATDGDAFTGLAREIALSFAAVPP
jgi:hypothetical protein